MCVQINIGIGRLDVHLVRIPARESLILRIKSPPVLNDCPLQKVLNELEVLRIYFDVQGFNATILPVIPSDLHGPVGHQVPPELAKVFAVVIVQDQNRIPDVLARGVRKPTR